MRALFVQNIEVETKEAIQAKDHNSSPQLLFTTHDTSLLDAYGLFRRDQIWFIEKNRDQSSSLYPLTDFSPRKKEALERGYLQGRYGAIPLTFLSTVNFAEQCIRS